MLFAMMDAVEHLSDCYESWQTAEPYNEPFLTASMKRDLQRVRRLCDLFEGQTDLVAAGRGMATA